jgi:hypothetical protein
MAKGKELGEFSLKSVTITASPGPSGSTMLQGNFEGPGTGIGTVILTATFVGRKSGTFSTCGGAFGDEGEIDLAARSWKGKRFEKV